MHNSVTILNITDCTLKNGYSGKFCYFLPQLKINFKIIFKNTSYFRQAKKTLRSFGIPCSFLKSYLTTRVNILKEIYPKMF